MEETKREEGSGEEMTATLLCGAASAMQTINMLLLAMQAEGEKSNSQLCPLTEPQSAT